MRSLDSSHCYRVCSHGPSYRLLAVQSASNRSALQTGISINTVSVHPCPNLTRFHWIENSTKANSMLCMNSSQSTAIPPRTAARRLTVRACQHDISTAHTRSFIACGSSHIVAFQHRTFESVCDHFDSSSRLTYAAPTCARSVTRVRFISRASEASWPLTNQDVAFGSSSKLEF